jgi:large subunit ribosomal protein L19
VIDKILHHVYIHIENVLNNLVKLSRESIPAEEQEAIFAEVYSQLQQLERTKKLKRKRTFVRPKRIG